MAEQFFNPQLGPAEFQTLRRQPFGLRGELELRGKQGGQTIAIPVRLFRTTFALLKEHIAKIQDRVGTHGELSYTGPNGISESYTKVTMDAAVEQMPFRYIREVGSQDRAGYECVYLLVFRRLSRLE